MRAVKHVMRARLVVAALAVAGWVLSVAAVALVASNSTKEYFALMRAYLGEEGFARHPCLAEQEKHGWVSTSTHEPPMHVFTWGVEGVGHHTFETLIGHAFSTLQNNGGQVSVPRQWRHKQRVTKMGAHDNADIAAQVASGTLLVFAIRYPPSSLVSAVSRFQNTSGHKNNVHEAQCNVRITGCDELFTLHDSLSFIDDALRYPDFDCGRLIIVPFAVLTQRPMALYGPLSQVMQLSKMGKAGYDLLETRLRAIAEHPATPKDTTSGHHYNIMEEICTDLALSHNKPNSHPPAVVTRPATAVKTQDPDFLDRPCAHRVYNFAETYFDERRYMFQSVYPNQALIDASRAKHPGSGLHFDDLLGLENSQ